MRTIKLFITQILPKPICFLKYFLDSWRESFRIKTKRMQWKGTKPSSRLDLRSLKVLDNINIFGSDTRYPEKENNTKTKRIERWNQAQSTPLKTQKDAKRKPNFLKDSESSYLDSNGWYP